MSYLWRCSIITYHHRDQWKKLFCMPRGSREFFMRPDQREAYALLPETIIAFRGISSPVDEVNAEQGFHYSLNWEIAALYAANGDSRKRYAADCPWTSYFLDKRNCFYLGGYNRQVICVPGHGAAQALVKAFTV
jgi:hypothetical protein